jgi:hypothetical protein
MIPCVAMRSLIGLSIAYALCSALSAKGQWQSLSGGVNGEVETLIINEDSSAMLVGGAFPYVREDSLKVNNLASWDGLVWSNTGLGDGNGDTTSVGSWWNKIVSLAIFHDTLFCGISANNFQYHPEWSHGAALFENEWFSIGNPENWFYLTAVRFSCGQT